MSEQSDQQLLRDYAERQSETAFAALVHRYADLVYSAALRLVGDADAAKDVTQNVFVALARNGPRLTDRIVLAGWLHGTTRNIAVKAVRTDARRRAREQEATAMNQLLSAETDPSWEQIAPQLDEALGELSEPDRDALLLRYFKNHDLRTVGALLGVSDDAAQKRVSRAVERLREFFARRGIAVGAGGLVVIISANAVQAAPVGLVVTISAAVLAELGKLALVSTGTAAASTATATVLGLNAKLAVAVAVAAVGVGGYVTYRATRPAETAPLVTTASIAPVATEPASESVGMVAGTLNAQATVLSSDTPDPATGVSTDPLAMGGAAGARRGGGVIQGGGGPQGGLVAYSVPLPGGGVAMGGMVVLTAQTRDTAEGALTLFARALDAVAQGRGNLAQLEECFAGAAEAKAFRRLLENPETDAERELQQVLKSLGSVIQVVQTTATEDGLKVKWKAAVQQPLTTTVNGVTRNWRLGEGYELELRLKQVGGEWKIVGF